MNPSLIVVAHPVYHYVLTMPGRTCLVVDDDRFVRKLIRAVLNRGHIDTLEAATAREALRIVQQREGSIDVIISDIQMGGGMNGIELAHRVKSTFPALPLILISGFRQDDAICNTSANFFIPKPFKPGTLVAAVNTALACASRHKTALANG